MLNSIRDDPQGQDLGIGDCLLACLSVGKYAGQFGDFAKPAAIFFLFYFNEELHLHSTFTGRWGR